MQKPIIEQHFIETLQNSRISRYPKSTLMLHYYSFQFLLLFLPFSSHFPSEVMEETLFFLIAVIHMLWYTSAVKFI